MRYIWSVVVNSAHDHETVQSVLFILSVVRKSLKSGGIIRTFLAVA